jgi:hypothetical protein
MHGEYLTPHLPRGADARHYLKLINEVQMLMHSHPVNLARESDGRLAVNGLWLWGGGTLPAGKVGRNAEAALDLIAGDGFELQSLARLAGHKLTAPPKALANLNSSGRVLVALTPPNGDWDVDVKAHLAQLEQNWFQPLLQRLTWGRIRQFRLDLLGQRAVSLTPGQAWQVWR